MDAPDIDNVVLIPDAKKLRAGIYSDVRIIGTGGCDLVAEPVRGKSKRGKGEPTGGKHVGQF